MSQNGQVALSNEVIARVKTLQKEGQSFNDALEQVVKLGCYQLEYRRETNPKKAIEQKLMRQVYRKAQTDPELAVKLGLGTRQAL